MGFCPSRKNSARIRCERKVGSIHLSTTYKAGNQKSRGDVKDEGCQTALQLEARSISDLRKQPKEPTVSPDETVARKPEDKRKTGKTKTCSPRSIAL